MEMSLLVIYPYLCHPEGATFPPGGSQPQARYKLLPMRLFRLQGMLATLFLITDN